MVLEFILNKKRRYNLTGIKRVLYKHSIGDRRCLFEDLSTINPQRRVAKSHLLQFYDRADNIGNYLPVLGIRKMLSDIPDTWDIHDENIDFDFINKSYKGIIIGGAGLLCPPFKNFWLKFQDECKLPTIIWGVGSGIGAKIGEHFGKSQMSISDLNYCRVVSEVSKRCDLVNVRDELTAEYFELHNPDISACPTIVYMQNYDNRSDKNFSQIVYSSHDIDSKTEKNKIKNIINRIYHNFKFTDNVQHPYIGLEDIVQDYYLGAKAIITTRLHGAIIAYGLKIPYIGITRGEKIRSFHAEYGNGLLVEDLTQLQRLLDEKIIEKIDTKSIAIEPVLDFGSKAKNWAKSLS
jgi:hypothetical protein